MKNRKWIVALVALVAAGAGAWGLVECRGRAREARREAAFAAAKPGEIVWRAKAGRRHCWSATVCEGAVVCPGDSIWGKERIRAFNPHTGTRLWERTVTRRFPTWVPEAGLFIHVKENWTVVDPRTGRAKAFRWPSEALREETKNILRLSETTLCFQTDAGVNAFEYGKDGPVSASEKWRFDVSDPKSDGIATTNYSGGAFIFVATAKSLHALDATTGQMRWQVPVEGLVWSIVSGEGVVCISRYLGGSKNPSDVCDAATGNLLWSRDEAVHSIVSPAGVMTSDKDGVCCLDLRTGVRRWSYPTTAQPLWVSALESGSVYCVVGRQIVELDAASGVFRRQFNTPSGVIFRTTLSGDAMYFADNEAHIVCVKMGEGR